ncbi:SPW repeat domain-containing protein [Paractinoplanes hotanensis]|uniref:SPW repeat protein n=1 Tax=Paractinoplanes hotanensis TaxID=2906497 RepID=A0ABT0XR86_9ACTN|nr:SPW repeat protein [Actinoplanes hotanensis]MCM4076291.1 SPW repeat protein [Actinoplanes hotanensis]
MPAQEAVGSRVARRLSSDIVLTPSAFVLLGGVWLAITPVIIDHGVYPWWNDVVAGALLIVLSVAQVVRPGRSLALSVAAALTGVWMVAAPFVLGYHEQHGVAWSGMLVGALVVLLSFVNGLAARPRPR